MSKLLKKFSLVIIFAFILLHVIPLFSMVASDSVQNFLIKHTYIGKIISPTFGEKNIRNILDNFNSRGYNSIIKYEGSRPIIIYEADRPKTILGTAWPLPGYCPIALDPKMESYQLRWVVVHEVLHCFFYDHSKRVTDIMYPYLWLGNPWATERSINKYAKEIFWRMYGNE